jgi:hypothetical protein
LNASFSVVFNTEAPIIVIVKSFASRPHLRSANHATTNTVAHVRKSAEPRNEMPRITSVKVGEAKV